MKQFILLILCTLVSLSSYTQIKAPNKVNSKGERTGKWVLYIDADRYFLNEPDGSEVTYYLINYKRNNPQGFTREFDLDGNLLWEAECSSINPDIVNGIAKGFYLNRNVKYQHTKINNVINGEVAYYYESGQLKWSCRYTDDFPDGLYSEYYENGNLMRQGSVSMGKKDGQFAFYRSDGTLEKIRTYSDDKETGYGADYDTLGRIQYDGNMLNGNWHGVLSSYDSIGEASTYYILYNDSVQELKTIIQDISFSLMLQNFDEGLEKSLMLEEYFRKVYGEDSPLYPFAVTSIAQFYYMMGDMVKGPEWAEKSFYLEQARVGADDEVSDAKWHLLGLMLQTYDKEELALLAFERALYKSYVDGKPTSKTVEYLERTAELKIALGEVSSGIRLYSQIEDICNASEEIANSVCANAVLGYATQLHLNYKYEEALQLLDRNNGLAEFVTVPVEWFVETARNLMSLNRSEEAIQLYAGLLSDSVFDVEEVKIQTEIATSLATYYLDAGNIAEAEKLYLKAEQWNRQFAVSDSGNYYQLLDNLAEFYAKVGRYPISIEYAGRVRDYYYHRVQDSLTGLDNLISRELLINQAYGSALTLGRYLEYAGYWQEAGQLYNNVLESAAGFSSDTTLMYAIAMEAAAGIEMYMGEYSRSEELYLKALSISDEYWKGINVNELTWKDNLSELYIRMDRFDEALTLANEVLNGRMEFLGKGDPLVGISYKRKSYILESLGDYEQAIDLYSRFLNDKVDMLSNNFSVMNGAEQQAYLRTFRFNFDIFSGLVARHGEVDGAYNKLLDMQLINRALLLYSSSASRREFQENENEAVRETYSQWLKKQQYLNSNAVREAITSDEINVLQAEADSLEKTLNLMVGSSVKFVPSVSTDAIQNTLHDGEAFVSLIRYPLFDEDTITEWRYMALVLNGGKSEVNRVDLESEQFFRQLLAKPRGMEDRTYTDKVYGWPEWEEDTVLYKGDVLFANTWKKILPIIDNVDRIYYSVSGVFHAINLSAIPTSFDEVMATSYSMYRLSSATNLINQQTDWSLTDETKTVMIGGVDYKADASVIEAASKSTLNIDLEDTPVYISNASESVRGGNWDYLPGTLAEVKSLSKNRPRVEVSTGAMANEYYFKSLQGEQSPGLLHIATHGFFNEIAQSEYANPMFASGLILAGASSSDEESLEEDGILTAAEISFLDLKETELVILSACETGLGEIQNNEGVFGLQRAFTLAGTNHIIMSLWKVSDRETALFMTYLYDFLEQGQTIQQAFTSTQRSMSKRYGPYYWAAFVLQH